MHPERRQEALTVFYGEFKRLVDEVAETAVGSPGCHAMWVGKDSKAFLEQKHDPNAYRHFSEYRAKLKVERGLVGLDGKHRTLLAWRDREPIGGVVLYNDKIIGSERGVIQFVAHLGPFLTSPGANRMFMRWMLHNEVRAEDDDGKPLRAQLIEWRHESEEKANRWRSNTPSASIWLGIDDVEGDYKSRDGVMVRDTTRKLSARG